MTDRQELEPTLDTAASSEPSAPFVGARERVADRLMHAEVMRELLGDATEDSAATGLGTSVDRFVVLGRIGAGGMGTVYLAYDPELDRRVALKVVLPTGTAKHDQRLRREALALARLTHPNVVTIHEVGTSGNDLFLAMEYVEGVDLAGWAREHPVGSRKRFAAALELLRRAGAGLAAAHRAGLVHRDFKPSNVLVGNDGRVKVADFGLARTPEDTASSPSPEGATTDDRMVATLTATGALVGTPRYMAPEQQVGGALDARTDQFAFCVTAWEVLFGSPAWKGMPDPESPPTPPRWAPRWLRRVFAKGLAARPEERYGSMDELLSALRRGRLRARLQLAAIAIGAAAMAAVSVEAYAYRQRAQAIAACEEEGASIDAVWNEERSAELRDAMLATGLGYAAASADRVAPWLDEYAQAWNETRTRACLRAHVEHTWDADVHERATWCLDERKLELDAMIQELTRGGAPAVRAAVPAASNLPRLESCLDPEALLPAPPEDVREALGAVRDALSRAHARYLVGDFEAGLEAAKEGLALAREAGWTPKIATAGARVGELQYLVGDSNAAEKTLQDAYFQAVDAGLPALAHSIAAEIAGVIGQMGDRFAEAFLWMRHADTHRKHVADPTGLLLAGNLYELGAIQQGAGEYDAAIENYARALAIREEVLGPEHPTVGLSLVNAAMADQLEGNYAAAEEKARRALAIFERSVGPEHSYFADALSRIGEIRHAAGDYEEARAMHARALGIRRAVRDVGATGIFESVFNLAAAEWVMGLDDEAFTHAQEALAIAEATVGRNDLWVARALVPVATMQHAAGELDEARTAAERAVRLFEAALGPEHPDITPALIILGAVHLANEAYAEARPVIERALALRERALGPDHPDLAVLLVDLASVHRANGAYAEALAAADRAHAILEQQFGPDHPDLAYALLLRSAILQAQGDGAGAIAAAERAVALREANTVAATDVATARFALARALRAANGDPSRAAALAQQALDVLRGAGPHHEAEAAEVDAWLREVDPRGKLVGARAHARDR